MEAPSRAKARHGGRSRAENIHNLPSQLNTASAYPVRVTSLNPATRFNERISFYFHYTLTMLKVHIGLLWQYFITAICTENKRTLNATIPECNETNTVQQWQHFMSDYIKLYLCQNILKLKNTVQLKNQRYARRLQRTGHEPLNLTFSTA